VKISGSAASSDTLALHDRKDMLFFDTAHLSAGKAMKQVGLTLNDINFFEYHDTFSIYAALQLEAVGFTVKGKGWKARRGRRDRSDGKNPLRDDGRHEGARIRGRRRGRVSGCGRGHPAER
jgi:acetyl-CoA C-acetyltransferase